MPEMYDASYDARALGIVCAVLGVVLAICGIGMIARFVFGFALLLVS